MTTQEIQDLTADDFWGVEKFKANFQSTMDYADIQIGERIFWTTYDKNHVWYHSGIPYKAPINYILYIVICHKKSIDFVVSMLF